MLCTRERKNRFILWRLYIRFLCCLHFFDHGLQPALSSVAENALYAGYIFSRRGVGAIGKNGSDTDTSAAAGSKLEPTTIE